MLCLQFPHCFFLRFAAPIGNGGCTDKYWWTQTLSEVNVMLKLPAGTKGRDVSVKIMTERLRVQIKGEAAPIIDVRRLVVCLNSSSNSAL